MARQVVARPINVAGLSTCDGGLVIDLSSMDGIRVDPAGRTVRAESGCTWGDLDHATHAFGLATPGGIVSTTGVGELTIGGDAGAAGDRTPCRSGEKGRK